MNNLNEKSVVDNYLDSIIEVYEWMKKQEIARIPSPSSEDPEEQRLGRAFSTVNRYFILPYLNLKTEDAKRKYEEKNPEINEVLKVKYEIDKQKNISYYLKIAKDAKREYEEKYPDRELPIKLENIISNIENIEDIENQIYIDNLRKQVLDNIKSQKQSYHKKLPKYLVGALEIQRWMYENNTKIPPDSKAKDEEEQRLGKLLKNIRIYIINPYQKLETENEKERYKNRNLYKKRVIEIIEEIDRNDLSNHSIAIKKIQQWMKEHQTYLPPSVTAQDKEEKELGNALINIEENLIQPYLNLKTDRKKRIYENNNPELKMIMRKVKYIERVNKSTYVVNARRIRVWMDKYDTNEAPSLSSQDEEEKTLGIEFKVIRQRLINPYLRLETEEKRQEYEEKRPEIKEVMKIIGETIYTKRDLQKAIDVIMRKLVEPYMSLKTEEERMVYRKKHPELTVVMNIGNEITNAGNRKKEYLLDLIVQDKEKRNALKDAKALEENYEEELLRNKRITNEEGAGLDEQ